MTPAHSCTILMADDDEDDCRMTADAFAASQLEKKLRFVHDGDELLDYLRHQGQFSDPESAPRPGLIVLDLNMPRVSGQEALQQIKTDPELRKIPVIVMSTSQAQDEVQETYDLGANSFISKPTTFQGLVDVVRTMSSYWFDIVELPEASGEA